MPQRPALKICGIVRQADLDFCTCNGVDYVGFNFYRGSKRYIQPADAARLWANRKLGASERDARSSAFGSRTLDYHAGRITKSVGVVVNPSRAELAKLVSQFPGLEVLQFHGEEPDDLIIWVKREYPELKIWRAAPVGSEADLQRAQLLWHREPVDLILLDTAAGGGEFGGTGRSFDWQLLLNLGFGVCPLILCFGIAGGIRPELIPALMKVSLATGCSLLDVASGVETSPGVKSPDAISRVIEGIDLACDLRSKTVID